MADIIQSSMERDVETSSIEDRVAKSMNNLVVLLKIESKTVNEKDKKIIENYRNVIITQSSIFVTLSKKESDEVRKEERKRKRAEVSTMSPLLFHDSSDDSDIDSDERERIDNQILRI